MKLYFSRWVLTLALAMLPVAVLADTMSDLDSYYQELYPSEQPGASIIITRNGEPVYRKAFGMADMELGVANQSHMVFRLGSITKQFTAVAIMMLEQQGKLKVSDDITEYLPGYQVPSSPITIEHLLTHTSGITNYTSIPGWFEKNLVLNLSDDEMMDSWETLPLEFEPGSDFAYSNSGYYMLGAIIKAASGMPYDEFIETRIFEPLGMENSYYDHSERLIPNRAAGYTAHPDGSFSNAVYIDMGQPGGAGALASTVDDMAKWDASLYTDALLSEENRQRMWTPFELSDGTEPGYGYGWFIGEHNGNVVVQHGGGIPGFQTSGYRLPELGVYVSVLSNGAASSPGVAAQAAVKAMLEEPFRSTKVEMDEEELGRYVGSFETSEGEKRSFVVKDGALFVQVTPEMEFPLTPIGDGLFEGVFGKMQFGGEADATDYIDILRFSMQATRWQKVE